MALTGLFLVLFLLVHMAGNLMLFLPEGSARPLFNAYSQVLSSSVVIKVAGWLTYAAVVVHGALGAVFARRHRRVRQAYAMEQPGGSSPWYARSMGRLGVIIFVFLVLHLHSFWYRYHWGDVGTDLNGNKDLYAVVVTAFCEPWIVLTYVVSMVALGFHLQHGIAASVRSLGIFSGGIQRVAPRLACWVAWPVAGAFAAMPVYVYLAFGGQAP